MIFGERPIGLECGKEKTLAQKSHAVFPAPGHDHARCASDAIAHAEALCTARKERLTPIRGITLRNVKVTILATYDGVTKSARFLLIKG